MEVILTAVALTTTVPIPLLTGLTTILELISEKDMWLGTLESEKLKNKV